MSRDIAFIPVADDREHADLVYRDPSRARGLFVLMQDASTRATPSRRRFLLACFRDTVAAWSATDRLTGAAGFLRERVVAFDGLARAVDTRLDDFEELGVFVAVREGAALYVLCGRGAAARVRSRGGFLPLSSPDADGVAGLSIETARSQHDLFAPSLPQTLALYRVTVASDEHGEREVLLGGAAQDIGIAADLASGSIPSGAREVRVDRVRHCVLMLTVEAAALDRVGASASTMAARPAFVRPGRRAAMWGATSLVVVAVAIAGVGAWRSAQNRSAEHAVTAVLKESPVPPPAQKRVMEDIQAEQQRTAEADSEAKAPEFAVAWQQSYRAAVTSSPAVAGDAVIFGGRDGRVYSIERASGETQWSYAAQGGVGASPVVRGAAVIAADYAGNVVRLRAGDGGVVWKRALGSKVVSTPGVSDQRVLVGTVQGRIYALSLETGRVLWKWSARGPVRGAVVYAKGMFVVPSNDGRLYALVEETGARRWVYPTGGAVTSSPATDGDIVVVGTARGDVVALDLQKGRPRWTYRAGGAVNSALAIEDGRVYAGAGDGRLHCIDAKSGEAAWSFDTGGVVLSRPFVDGGRVFVTSYDRSVYCLDAAAGSLIARYQTDEAIFSSPVMVDGRVYFGNNAGRFYCLNVPQS
ncbi:MAG TPA: PQQ-binding-like beta-propeller repeat protein [Candidatus Krumholzibacteria bacterium]